MNKTLRFGIIGLLVFIVFSMAACDDDADNGGEESKEPGAISVTVTPKNYTVHRGHEQSFFVTVNNTNEKAVTWSIVGNGLNANTKINQSGLLSVSPDEEQTALTVKVTLAADTSIYGTAAVSIPAPTISGVDISLADGVVISPWYPANKAIDIDSGRTEQFLAKVVGQHFPKQDVIWTITGNVSSGTSITGGLLTVSPDEPLNKVFTVKAASTVDPDRVDTITVTVRPPTINTFRVVPSSNSIAVSSPVEFAVTVLGSGNVRGRYEIEWTVERSDGRPIMLPGTEVEYDNRDGTFTTWKSLGTRFEGNTLYTTADEVQGVVEEDEDGVETVTVYDYTLDVTAELKPASPVNVAASVLTTYEISLEVEDTFSPSLIDF
jgi:hypothetical protein